MTLNIQNSTLSLAERAVEFFLNGPTVSEIEAWLSDDRNRAAFVQMGSSSPHLASVLDNPKSITALTENESTCRSIVTGAPIFLNKPDVWSRVEKTEAWAMLYKTGAVDNLLMKNKDAQTRLASPNRINVFRAAICDVDVHKSMTKTPSMMSAIDATEPNILVEFVLEHTAIDPALYADIDAVAASSVAMDVVAASSVAMDAVAASSVAMDAVAASSIAMTAVAASSVAMDAVIALPTALATVTASSVAMTAVAASSVAMDGVIASPVAMTAVAASSVAMTAVAASQPAIDAVAASTDAMTSIRNSTTAMQALRDSPLALEAQSAFARWDSFATVGAASNQVSIIIDSKWSISSTGWQSIGRNLYPGGGEQQLYTSTSTIYLPAGYAFSNFEMRADPGAPDGIFRYVRYIPTTIPNPV